MATILKRHYSTARKNHYCALCCNQIKVGERYFHEVFVEDRELYDNKLHEDCIDAIDAALDYHERAFEEDISFAGISDDIVDMYIERHGTREGVYFPEIIKDIAEGWRVKQIKDAVKQVEEEQP